MRAVEKHFREQQGIKVARGDMHGSKVSAEPVCTQVEGGGAARVLYDSALVCALVCA